MTQEGFFENPFLNGTYWVICNDDHTTFMLLVEEVEGEGDGPIRLVFFEQEEDAHNYFKRDSQHVPPGSRVQALTSEQCLYVLDLHLTQHQVWGVIFLTGGDTLHLDFKSYMVRNTGPGGGYNTIEA